MKIQEILVEKLRRLYEGESGALLQAVGKCLEPDSDEIVRNFYAQLLEIPELAPLLENATVKKNLIISLVKWIEALFVPRQGDRIQELIERQKKIGAVHTGNNLDFNYFTHGISILKREIFTALQKRLSGTRDRLLNALIVICELFDILISVISEAYFSNEIVHETMELSLKMKETPQSLVLQYERLRSMLFDWLRQALTHLYRKGLKRDSIPKLRDSNYGLWLIYKADLASHTVDISVELKQQVRQIDELLVKAADFRIAGDEEQFNECIGELNEQVTKVAWFISSFIEEIVELDSGTDPLTHLFNRRYLDTLLRREMSISFKQGLPFCILMIDMDHFKSVNDKHGHDCGDAVLKQFAQFLLMMVRSSDFVFRYGGEEFLIILSNANRQEGVNIAEKIRRDCETYSFQIAGGERINRTCSIGVSFFQGHPDFNKLVKQADMALYEAKNGGRNRVVAYKG